MIIRMKSDKIHTAIKSINNQHNTATINNQHNITTINKQTSNMKQANRCIVACVFVFLSLSSHAFTFAARLTQNPTNQQGFHQNLIMEAGEHQANHVKTAAVTATATSAKLLEIRSQIGSQRLHETLQHELEQEDHAKFIELAVVGGVVLVSNSISAFFKVIGTTVDIVRKIFLSWKEKELKAELQLVHDSMCNDLWSVKNDFVAQMEKFFGQSWTTSGSRKITLAGVSDQLRRIAHDW